MALTPEAVQALRSQVWGQVLLPADAPAFDNAIKLWAIPIPARVPAVVVQPRGAKDVQAALKFAKQHGLEVSVKGGGHCPASVALVAGGLVIDMCLMRGVFVNAKAKIAVAQGGAQLGDIDFATAVYDLAVPLGHLPNTGMGLALNGGMGVLKSVFGPTAQHIIAATVVLADGSVVDVDKDTDPELLWGLQGAGTTLGVVTSLTFRLHDMSNAYSGLLAFPDDPEHKTWRAIANFMLTKARMEPGYSNNLVRGVLPTGQPMLFVMAVHVGSKTPEEKAEFIAPLRALGPAMDSVRAGKGAYADMQNSFLELGRSVPPHYEYWISGQMLASKVTDAFMDTFCRQFDDWPETMKPLSLSLFDMWRGPAGVNEGFALEQEGDTGPHGLLKKEAEIGWLLDAAYMEAADTATIKALTSKMKAELNGHGSDTDIYANAVSEMPEAPEESKLAARVGGADKLARLRALKARVDPDNVFKSHPFKGL